jgi:hypothetical protein
MRTRPSSRGASTTRRCAVLAGLLLVGAAACADGGGDGGNAATRQTAPAPAPPGPCPANLVIQTDWFPEVEHGGTYQLIGAGGRADKATFSYRGPLQNRYAGTHGVQTVEIRAGGAAIDNRTVSDVLYSDDSVFAGYVNTDDAIAGGGKGQPVIGVMASLDVSPQMLMWSPARYTITKPTDLAKTRTKVLHFPGSTYIDYLVSEGYVTIDQLDDSYKGDPTRWLESNGDIIQQGFATNEVFTYENLIDGWRKPVDFFLIHWMGYENYPAMLSVPSDRLDASRACLRELVPVMQRAWVDYLTDPSATNDTLVEVNDTYDTFFKLSKGLNARAMAMFSQFKLATNGSDEVLGNFDDARVERMVRIVSDVLTARGTPLPSGVTAASVATNEFVDSSIGLGRPTS